MKYYLAFIKSLQNVLLGVSLVILAAVPTLMALYGRDLSPALMGGAYTLSLAAVFFVMAIRPLADLFPSATWIRALVITRKGFGVLSASIIVSFLLAKLIDPASTYLVSMATARYWSLAGGALLAHLGDITGVILLVTSNSFSKRVLGRWWKRIQKLAYIYFYAGALYEMIVLGSALATVALVVVTTLVTLAWAKKRLEGTRRATQDTGNPESRIMNPISSISI